MRLVIDCFKQVRGAGKSIGIYNLARQLVRELAKSISKDGGKNEIIVLGNAYNKADFDVEGIKFIEIDKNPLNKLACIKWELFDVSVLAKKLGADRTLFPRGYASVLHLTEEYVIIHDMIPFYYDENYRGYFNRLENFYIMWRLKASAVSADRVITISEASKRDIIKYSHADERKIVVINNGRNPIKESNFGQLEKDYILAVTSALPHKNACGIMNAYAEYRKLAKNPIPLTIIGISGAEGHTDDITFIKYVDNDEKMHALIRNAKAFLFLSLIEGFGFPPIEAMQLETPVVCSNLSSLPEVIGDAALMVNPNDAQEAARALLKVTTDEEFANALIAKGLKNVERFDWNKTVERYKEVLFDEV